MGVGTIAISMVAILAGLLGHSAGSRGGTPGVLSAEPGQETGPGPRYGHELVYDPARGVTVLFGGFGNDGLPKQDTWLWDGRQWRLAATEGPSARKWPAGAFDARRGVIVLHGGREGPGRSGRSLDDTWIWDGERWSRVEGGGPPGRDHHRAVYDRGRDRVVLFGGWNGEGHLADTWEWDGSRWHHAATEGPAPRAAFGMVYDERSGEALLVGGQDLERTYGGMWRWDGSAWSRVDVETPGARGFHTMSYDPERSAVLLFGGRHDDVLLNDLWSWNGERWTQLDSGGPLLRGIYASAFDRDRAQLLIHGSGQREREQWQLESRTWAWDVAVGWRVVSGPEAVRSSR